MPKSIFRFGGRLQKYNELDEFSEPADLDDYYLDEEDASELFNLLANYDADYEENLRKAGNDMSEYVKDFILDLYNSVMYREETRLRGGALSSDELIKLLKGKVETMSGLSDDNKNTILKKISKYNKEILDNFVSKEIDEWDALGFKAFDSRLRLYYYLKKINQNSEEGYEQRIIFFNTLMSSGDIMSGYNIKPAEVGFICEFVFVENFVKGRVSDEDYKLAKPNISKWVTSVLYDPTDLEFGDYAIEIKSLAYARNRKGCKYSSPTYFAGSGKVKKMLKSHRPHKIILWAEICNDDELINSRHSVPNYRQYVLDNQLFESHKQNGLITEAPNFRGEMTYKFSNSILTDFTGLP